MKYGPDTITLLQANNTWLQADLLTIVPRVGDTIRLTSWQSSLTHGGNSYYASGLTGYPAFQRGSIENKSGTEVSVLRLSLFVGALNDITMSSKVVAGYLDGAAVTLTRVIALTAAGLATAEAVHLFSGTVQDREISDNEIMLSVHSLAILLNTVLPKRKMIPSCAYAFCDAACGLAAASYTTARTITGGTNFVPIVDGSFATNYYKGGVFVVTSGAQAGARRTILSNTSGGALTLDSPLVVATEIGDTVTTMRGCAKTYAACLAYSNQLKFPGFPTPPRSNKK